MSDDLETMIAKRDALNAKIEAEERKSEKLRLAQLEAKLEEFRVLSVNALALIGKAKFHSDHAAQVAAVKKGLMDLARAA